MDLRYSEEYEKFRQAARAFLADNWPPPEDGGELGPRERAARFRERAIECGYLARAFPRRYGGSEQEPDVLRGMVIRQEFGRVGAPMDVGVPGAQLMGTLLEHGTEEQKQRYLPASIRGELAWCQGYSEPGSGSDLASVQTRAELVGNEWVINGQKIWTSGAQQADMIYLLCRTEPDAGKHAGISYLLLDMKQPGIDVRPLRQMDGTGHFSEVFFDDARTPADQLVGKRGEGWLVSRSTLKHERNTVGDLQMYHRHLENLVELARTTIRDGRPALEDPTIRQRLAELDGYVKVMEYSGYRQLTCSARGEDPGTVVPMNRLATTKIEFLVANLGLELIGDSGLEAPSRMPFGDTAGSWARQYMWVRAYAIAGGASNIQRNIIGERALGLPRDFAAQKSR